MMTNIETGRINIFATSNLNIYSLYDNVFRTLNIRTLNTTSQASSSLEHHLLVWVVGCLNSNSIVWANL